MTFELAADGACVKRGHGRPRIEPARPAGLLVDLQYAFTEPAFRVRRRRVREPAAA